MPVIAAVFLGGGLGALLRHGLNTLVTQYFHRDFPLGIMLINILGSFLMGLLVGLFTHFWDAPQHLRTFITVGLLGGLTTFSSFSLDAVLLLERGEYLNAGIYIIGSVIASLLALIMGMALVRMGVSHV